MTSKVSRPFFFFSLFMAFLCLSPAHVYAARTPQLKRITAEPQTNQEIEQELPGLPGSPSKKNSRNPASVPATEVAPATGLPITRVVGEAGEQIITSREVQINDMLEQAVYGRLPGQTEIRALRGNEKAFPNEVQTVLREWIIFIEAKSFDSGDVTAAEVQRSVKTAEDALKKMPAWQALEPSGSEVSEILERKMVAKKFLRLKTDSAQVPITDAEALAYYKKNRIKFGSLPFSSFRENIKTFLIKQQMDRRLQEWLEVLERKYKVRNFIAG